MSPPKKTTKSTRGAAAARRAPVKTTRSLREAEAAVEGPLYRIVGSPTLLDNREYAVGEKAVYYGLPGSTLVGLNDEAKSRKRQVRDIRLNDELDSDEKAAALKELSDEWNGVVAKDAFSESEANLDGDDDAEAEAQGEKDPELIRQAIAGQAGAKTANDPNVVGVKLQGLNRDDESAKIGDDKVNLQTEGAKAAS